MYRPERRLGWALGATCILAACSGAVPRPVEFAWNEEACSQCRMAVSQEEFAGEIVTVSGAVYYFDDIGCLARWTAENEVSQTAGWFVMDYETRHWLDARIAYYVRSDRFPTPMSYGLAAFETRDHAGAAANRLDGEVIEWTDVLEGGT